MIYGYPQQPLCFKTLADKDSSQIQPFKNKAVHFSGTAAGLTIGLDALGQNVSFPTHAGFARDPTQQKIVNNHKLQADPIHRVSKGDTNHQVLELVKMAQTKDQGGVKQGQVNQVTPVTPVKIDQFAKWIHGYEFENYLLTGLQEGFRIGYEGPRSFRDCTNLKSCREHPLVISDKIANEQALGRIQGPFDRPPFPNIQCSPIGVVPKKKLGEFRLIQHLSYPEGSSINDFICEELSTVKYSNFDDAVAMVLFLGTGCQLCKTDIEEAYRILPINKLDHELLGIKWQNKYYYDNCLSMGLRSSAAIFDRFSSGLKWMAQTKLGIDFILHILDDFLI